MTIRGGTLANGLAWAVEESPSARSVAAGFFAKTGARDEPAAWEGVSHFLEHMCFKGTPTRDALELSRVLDEMGARANAWTSWEETAYYVQILPEKLETGVDLLSDMMRPALRDEDYDLEKKVILEEIALYEDRPDFLLFDHAVTHRYAAHPLGKRILGKPETIAPLPAAAMRSYHAERYSPGGMRFVAAGAVHAEEVVALLESRAGAWPTRPAPGRDRPAAPPPPPPRTVPRPKDHEIRLVRLTDGPAAHEEDAREAARLLASVIGDSTGSRFYWGILHPGLAEEASFFHEAFDGCGSFGAVLVAGREAFPAARAAFDRILAEVAANPPSDEEISRAIRKAVTEIRLAAESPLSRFRTLGARLLDGLPLRSPEEAIARLRSVPPDAVRDLARTLSGSSTEILLA